MSAEINTWSDLEIVQQAKQMAYKCTLNKLKVVSYQQNSIDYIEHWLEVQIDKCEKALYNIGRAKTDEIINLLDD